MDKLYYTIRQISEVLGERPHVIRYWEKIFPVRPAKTRTGQRRYRADDLVLLQGIRRMLRDEGLTVDGAKKRLDRRSRLAEQADSLGAVRQDLQQALDILQGKVGV